MFGLVHQPTFLEYYRRLDNPTNDALVLAICVDALPQIRHMLKYNSSEIRALIDIFYDRCRDLLFDMYDDPTKKLQIIMTTTLLQQYVSDVVLNFAEARLIISLALLRHYFRLEMLNRTHRLLEEYKIDFTMSTSMEMMEVLDDEPEKTKEYMLLPIIYFGYLDLPMFAI
ncbi:hypothetical protein BJV82DRAFT_667505 [Fennellomyces sp. T-0311]|nr:hypothetical protein BJV82DRAFT_667505 [Fennellomyces sp. T-0311]